VGQNLPVWQDIVEMEGGRHWASQMEAVPKSKTLCGVTASYD
jgi:hypothetical protein